AALARPCVGIEVEAADRPARGARDLEKAHVRVPHRRAATLPDAHIEQPLGDLEQASEYPRQRKIRAQLFLRYRVALALQPLREEADVPGFQGTPGERLELLEFPDRRGPGRPRQLLEELHDLRNAVRHSGRERIFRVVAEA